MTVKDHPGYRNLKKGGVQPTSTITHHAGLSFGNNTLKKIRYVLNVLKKIALGLLVYVTILLLFPLVVIVGILIIFKPSAKAVTTRRRQKKGTIPLETYHVFYMIYIDTDLNKQRIKKFYLQLN